MTEQPEDAEAIAARDWSSKFVGRPIGNRAATGCWQAMFDAIPNRRAQPSSSLADRDAEIARLREALEPFSRLPIGTIKGDESDADEPFYQTHGWPGDASAQVFLRDIYRVIAALSPPTDHDDDDDMKALVERLRYFAKIIIENSGEGSHNLVVLPPHGELLNQAANAIVALSRPQPVTAEALEPSDVAELCEFVRDRAQMDDWATHGRTEQPLRLAKTADKIEILFSKLARGATGAAEGGEPSQEAFDAADKIFEHDEASLMDALRVAYAIDLTPRLAAEYARGIDDAAKVVEECDNGQ